VLGVGVDPVDLRHGGLAGAGQLAVELCLPFARRPLCLLVRGGEEGASFGRELRADLGDDGVPRHRGGGDRDRGDRDRGDRGRIGRGVLPHRGPRR